MFIIIAILIYLVTAACIRLFMTWQNQKTIEEIYRGWTRGTYQEENCDSMSIEHTLCHAFASGRVAGHYFMSKIKEMPEMGMFSIVYPTEVMYEMDLIRQGYRFALALVLEVHIPEKTFVTIWGEHGVAILRVK
jgi:hypothetical protein